jgi:RNA polymerase sigma-70 factor (ECF subfamily)
LTAEATIWTRTAQSPPLADLWRWAVRVLGRLLFSATSGAAGAESGGISTAELITRFQRGQPRTFEALFNRYKDYAYRVAFYVIRHREEAEEAVQEAFLDVLRALPDYDVEGAARFETWLYRVVVNRCKMRLRRKRPPSVEWEEVDERLEGLADPVEGRPESAVMRRERAVDLWRAVDQLPDEHRMVLLLRYQLDLSYKEIAETLGIRLGTVKSRLYNAHRKLKDALEAEVITTEGRRPAVGLRAEGP